MPKSKSELEEFLSLEFFKFINSAIPQDLQKLYSDDVNKMKSSFFEGARITEKFLTSKNDK